eukprot:2815917-Alexandrium_andersonii.AAC.1
MYRTNACHAVIFIDLESAYDRTLRQRLFGGSDVSAELGRIGVSQAAIDETLAILSREGLLCEAAGVPGWVARLLESHHKDARVLPRSSGQRVVAAQGVKHGDIPAPMLLMLDHSRVVAHVHEVLRNMGVRVSRSYSSTRGAW